MSDPKELSKEEKELEQKMVKVVSKMPENVQDRFKNLHMYSDERSKINDLFEEEVKKLSAKMEARKRPLLDHRDNILKGEITTFEDLIPKYDEHLPELETIIAGIQRTDEEKRAAEEDDKEHFPADVTHLKELKGVPDFWSKAISGHPMIAQIISEKDAAIMRHATFLTAEKVEDPVSMITVEIHFEKNEFFTNESLKFCVRMGKDSDNPEKVEEVIGCAIIWKEGKDVTKKKIKKNQKNKKTKETRTITKTVPDDSFFNLFESKKIPDDFKDDEDDEDSETERTMQGLDEAGDCANDFYDMYAGEALEYYLGFGQSMSDLLGAMGQNPYGDEDDDDEDGDKPDHETKKKGKKGGKGGAGGAAGQKGPNGEECKQQ